MPITKTEKEAQKEKQRKHIERLKERDKKAHFKKKENFLRARGHRFEGEVDEGVEGFCMQCCKPVVIKNPYKATFKNKLKVYIGNCPMDDTEIYKRRKE